MSNNPFALSAVDRSADQQGKGASRRLRKQNLVPAIIYGGNEAPTAISLKVNELVKSIESEAFFSQILTITVDGTEHQAVIKALQRHPSKGFPMHADFQRIVKGQKITLNVPVHYEGAEDAPGTKAAGVLSTLVTDIEISCLPSKLPEALTVDVSGLEIGDVIRLSDVNLPEGVVINELENEEGHDRTIVTMLAPVVEEAEETADSVDASDVPATEQSDTDASDSE